jgi:hypothetical protein
VFVVVLYDLLLHWSQQDPTLVLFPMVQALYVSYEPVNLYKVGDRYV